MNTVFAFCLSLLVVTVLGAEQPSWCVSQSNKALCESSGLNITCVVNSSCVDAVANGDVDLVVVDAKTLVANVDKLEIVFVEKYAGIPNNVKYYGVAVVRKNSILTLKTLNGKKSCHTGAGKNAGWVIPVGYLLDKKYMSYVDNQYKSAANYFGGSCVPGVKSVASVKNDKTVTDKLCELCKNPTLCSTNDAYAGHKGAFDCMVAGSGEVAFVKHSTPGDTISTNATKYGNDDDYRLLCKDGGKKEISMYSTCNIARRPANAVVVTTKNKGKIEQYRALINKVNVARLVSSKLLSGGTEELLKNDGGTKKYLGEYYDDVKALNLENVNKAGSVAVSLVLQVLGILSVLLVF